METESNQTFSSISDHYSKIPAGDNLLNYLEVLSHMTGCLLSFRGKIFRGRLYEDNDQGEDSDLDSDDENSSNTLGEKLRFYGEIFFLRPIK